VSHLGNRTANFQQKQRQLGNKQTGNETKLIPMDLPRNVQQQLLVQTHKPYFIASFPANGFGRCRTVLHTEKHVR
jgi:hypothetical protein